MYYLEIFNSLAVCSEFSYREFVLCIRTSTFPTPNIVKQ
jgi:hypothetical protein